MAKDSSKLSLLNINAYIDRYKLKEVKNANIFGIGKKTFDEEGLWSEIIFGRIGSRERRLTFGYIELGMTLINPVVYKMMRNSSEAVRDILLEKRRFAVSKDGVLIEDEVGQTGIVFLTQNYKHINFESNAKKDRKDVGAFLNKNKELIFINKYLILPAGGIRDMSLEAKKAKQFSSEINDLYEKLISLNNQLKIHEDDLEMRAIFGNQIQKILIQTYTWIQNRMEGKGGILRESMLKKTLDYSARIVATSSPEIPLGKIGIPWHTILAIYEPFFFHWVLKKDPSLLKSITAFLGFEEDHSVGYHDLKTFNYAIAKNPDAIKEPLLSSLKHIAGEITKDKDILVKRDPVVSRTSYYSATPIPVDGRAAIVNAATCGPQGLDFDGDTIALMPVFTKEAIESTAKMNPAKQKSVWTNPTNYTGAIYKLSHDTISTIYALTKE